jgi:hypothetical protein
VLRGDVGREQPLPSAEDDRAQEQAVLLDEVALVQRPD